MSVSGGCVRQAGFVVSRAGQKDILQGGDLMRAPYGLDIIEGCLSCPHREDRLFCNLPPRAVETKVTLTLTHEEIAQMIGTSRETVTRIFGDFKKKQFVQVKGSTLIIKNKAGLENLLRS